jgi:membrane dipeptidase
VRRRGDLRPAEGGPLAAVLLMEGADPIGGPDDVARWQQRGLRIVGLTWARGTRYAGGNARPGPLTAAGRELVAALDEAGIAHDASHLADAALEDLLGLARGPVVATHSNCRAITGPGERHLRDDQIRAIGERDGIVGLNLYSRFLADGRPATIDDCVAHVQRVAELMGHRRGVALGSDMDGGFGPDRLPVGLDHPRHLDRLADALGAAGWSDEDVAGFTSGNWMRFLGTLLPE